MPLNLKTSFEHQYRNQFRLMACLPETNMELLRYSCSNDVFMFKGKSLCSTGFSCSKGKSSCIVNILTHAGFLRPFTFLCLYDGFKVQRDFLCSKRNYHILLCLNHVGLLLERSGTVPKPWQNAKFPALCQNLELCQINSQQNACMSQVV